VSSAPSCSDGNQSGTSSGTNTVSKSSRKESKTDSSMRPQSSETLTTSSSPVPLKSTRAMSMWLQQSFPANHSQLQATKKAKTTSGTSGRKRSNVFAMFDPDTHSWRTSQVCLILDTSAKSSLRWPKQGSMQDGLCSEQTMWEPRTDAKGFGSERNVWIGTPTASMTVRSEDFAEGRLPTPAEFVKMCKTPSAADAYTGNMKKDEFKFGNSGSLAQEVESGFLETHRMWPTPDTQNHRDGSKLRKDNNLAEGGRHGVSLHHAVHKEGGGSLNPTWVEWLMGWPLGWTDLKPLAMDKYQQWLQQHGRS
jgi:hypothetical protein